MGLDIDEKLANRMDNKEKGKQKKRNKRTGIKYLLMNILMSCFKEYLKIKSFGVEIILLSFYRQKALVGYFGITKKWR
jgi:hypothetical protein